MKVCIISENTIYSSIYKIIFYDLIKNGATFIDCYLSEKGIRKKVLYFLYKNKINRILKGHFEPFLLPKFKLEEFLFENEDSIVIFINGSLQKIYSYSNLDYIKRKFPMSTFVLLFVDSVCQKQASRAFELYNKGIFDFTFSFDINDCEKYGFNYTTTPYSKVKKSKRCVKGIYFSGSDKGRAEFIDSFAGILNSKNIKYKFNIFGVKKQLKNIMEYPNCIITYDRVLDEMMEYNCLLDVVQIGDGDLQSGLSLRVYEAITYNKILITNNKNIFNFKYYNPKFMHYIESPKDFKCEWLNDDVKYDVPEEISPLFLYNRINELKKIRKEIN